MGGVLTAAAVCFDVRPSVAGYIEQGFDVVPLRPRGKGLKIPRWQDKTFVLADFSAQNNVGIRLGKNGLADVDLDCPEAVTLSRVFLPKTGFVFGRASARASHYFYYLDPATESIKLIDPVMGKAKGTIIELRCMAKGGTIGLQTVAPGSIHEDTGELIEFEPGVSRIIQKADAEVVVTAVYRIGAAVVLARYWPAKGRHETMLALAGCLVRAGWKEAEALTFCSAVYGLIPPNGISPKAPGRVKGEVSSTFRRLAEGRDASGIPTLTKNIDKRAVDAALKWLGIGASCEQAAAAAFAAASEAEPAPAEEGGNEGLNGAAAEFAEPEPEPRKRTAESADGEGEEKVGGRSSKRARKFLWTDSGHANRLARIYGKDLKYCEDRRMFFVWAGTRWKFDKELHVQRLVEKMLLTLYNEVADEEDEAKRKAMLASIKSSLSQGSIRAIVDASRRNVVSIGPADFDLNPYLLNFKNGTLDLRTGEFRVHRREDLITKCIPYNYDPKAKAPAFYQFLSRIMGDHPEATPKEVERAYSLISYLKRAFGSASLGIAVKLIIVFYGSGNNGKTTLIEIMRAVLGNDEYAGQIQIESLMVRPSEASGSNAVNADLADLQGCRLVSASEPEKGMRFSVARIKYLTGLNEIKARYLKENPFKFKPSHTLFVDCNDKPAVSDPHDAIWNRLKAVPFTVTIPAEEIDTTLPDKLLAELPGIAVWMAEGAREYLQHGLPDIPEVKAATEEYQAESDKLREFVEDCCDIKTGNWCAITDVFKAYLRWATANSERFLLNRKAFKGLMEKRGFKEVRTENNSVRAFNGIALRDSPPDKRTEKDTNSLYVS